MRIVSLNIANYDDHKDWINRRKQICSMLISLQPDIICLQEVRFNPQQITCHDSYQNSAEELLHLLHSQSLFLDYRIITIPTMYYPTKYSYPSTNGKVIWEGKSIITNLTVLEYGNFLLTKPETSHDMNKRSIFWCRLKLECSDFMIGNLHWGLDEAARNSNATQTAQLTARFPDIPLIFVGDFNTDPDAPTQQKLIKANLTDLWLIAADQFSGYTFPASEPFRRIDQAWGNQLAVQSLKSIYIPKFYHMSDHLALLLELELK
jgi:endonuclease/exonuclease/phosphatase family metal-dependent hydrolase